MRKSDEATRLSIEAELARNYFQLRTVDALKELLDATGDSFAKSLELTRNRYANGVASKADVLQAETQLKTTKAQETDVTVQRAQLEHAMALLIGKPASVFSIPPSPLKEGPPDVPVGVPSELIERRPDIAAANAQIGVARAAYFPRRTLSASGGSRSSSFSDWFTWPSRFWSVGPAITQTVYDGGLRRARSDQARAAHDAAVAAYRQSVLTAFQGVEDNLAALRILEEEAMQQDEAVAASRQTVEVTTNRYKAGTVSYIEVLTAQATALNNDRTALDILGRRMTASVLLIKALGGGWKSSDLPSSDEVGTRVEEHQRTQ